MEMSNNFGEELGNGFNEVQYNYPMEEEVDITYTFSPASSIPSIPYNYDINYTQAYIEAMIWYLDLMQRRK